MGAGQASTAPSRPPTWMAKYELLTRAADGLHVYRWNAATDTFTDISKPPRLFSDATGGGPAQRVRADLFGDGTPSCWPAYRKESHRAAGTSTPATSRM